MKTSKTKRIGTKKSSKRSISKLNDEQANLIALMESSIDSKLLAAVERAYSTEDADPLIPQVDISYEGTVYA